MCIALAFAGLAPAAADGAEAPLALNAGVRAMARSGDTLFIGGGFTEIGPRTGPGISVDSETGRSVAPLEAIGGPVPRVKAVLADGRGGWYVGGTFRRVGGVRLRNLVHILPSGRLDRRFRPNPTGPVLVLARGGGNLYAGGTFRHIGGRRRTAVASLSPRSGRARRFDARIGGSRSFPAEVHALAVGHGRLYIGGSYLRAGGRPRFSIAAADASTGRLRGWRPRRVAGLVSAIAVAGSTVYVGGSWSIQPAGRLDEALRAFDAVTARPTAWNPQFESGNSQASPYVTALVATPRSIIVGGYFSAAAGAARRNLAEIDRATGRATAFDPQPNALVDALALGGETVYAGGGFSSIGGARRRGVAAISLRDGRATAWDARPSGDVSALALAGRRLYLGGRFTTIAAASRRRLAALDVRSGCLLPWNPGADAPVSALTASGGTVFAGGRFRQAGGRPRHLIAALDASNGAALPWDARIPLDDASNAVRALALAGSTLYVGGAFSAIGGQPRRHLAALDLASARATRWNPSPDAGTPVEAPALGSSTVGALLVAGNRVYVGGAFHNVGGAHRPYLAALDRSGGAAAPWRARANRPVQALALRGATLYAGGTFTRLGGAARRRLGALSVTTGQAMPFNPHVRADDRQVTPDSEIEALVVAGRKLYAGGRFRTIGRARRRALAALDARTGRALRLNARGNGRVSALLLSARTLFAGGPFNFMGGRERSGFAALDARTGTARVRGANSQRCR